ncbi:hypothetical protein LOC67_10915 [Stieleria sp. JC731]|uniref:hypothetical protein n=1 Tax=Pirellulaceae TaxID=2691357 RepID=UPI001E4DBE25|nr:hypothetical protein [Stieleria sp. JC731]MCC9601057.1 hypothetical protein [Stieleria sp. JC731]
MYQASRPLLRRRELQSKLFDRGTRQSTPFRQWCKTLGLTAGFLGGLAMPTVHADTPCDTYEPSCGAGLCDCGSCGLGHTELFTAAGCDDAGCDSCGPRRPHNPLFATLDKFAGGIEKTLGLDKCKCVPAAKACKCGVSHSHAYPVEMIPSVPGEAAPLKPLQIPASPKQHSAAPSLPSVPPTEVPSEDPPSTEPNLRPTPPRIIDSEPNTVEPPAAESVPQPSQTMPEPAETLPPKITPSTPEPPAPLQIAPQEVLPEPTEPETMLPETPFGDPALPDPAMPDSALPLPEMNDSPNTTPSIPTPSDDLDSIFNEPATPPAESATPPATPQPEKSPFDILDEELNNLDDPFSEDARNLRQPYRPVRPVGVRSSSFERPSSAKPIGSGLRPASNLRPISSPALLKPVSHEEPINQLSPLGGGGQLTPYRARR